MYCILCKTEGNIDPIKRISLPQISVPVTLKYIINPFPHYKILDQTKLKAFADEKLNATQKYNFCLQ